VKFAVIEYVQNAASYRWIVLTVPLPLQREGPGAG